MGPGVGLAMGYTEGVEALVRGGHDSILMFFGKMGLKCLGNGENAAGLGG
jgi:hypothetical protein